MWVHQMNPDRHHAVPIIGLAYDVMMTSSVFICDVITGCRITTS